MKKAKDILLIILLIFVGCIVAYAVYRDHRIKENTRIVQAKVMDTLRAEPTFEFNTLDTSLNGYLIMLPYITQENKGTVTNSLMIMDIKGKIFLKKDIKETASEFRQWRIGQKVYYTYWINDFGKVEGKIGFRSRGHIVVLDSALNEIKQVKLYNHGNINNNQQGLDSHDLIMLSENHFITLAGYDKTVNNIPDSLKPSKNGTKVVSCVIQESIDGKVVWQWDATDFPELYGASINTYTDTGVQDYTHVNSLIIDPIDSNVIVSFKHLHQILKISRKTGEIIWRLGGKTSDYELLPEQVFYGQHAAVFTDNGQTLMFIDNGDAKKRPYSRIIEVKLDEKNKKIASYKAIPIPHTFFPIQGNVNKIGDKYLVCGGVKQYICMFDPSNNKYLLDIRSNKKFYRVYWVDSIYGLERKAI